MARIKRVWNDGLKTAKTPTNPKGGGRVAGRDYSYLYKYPGAQSEQRVGWLRMKAQAKFRNEPFEITWEDYLKIWEGRWHQRGSSRESYTLQRIDWKGGWTLNNVHIVSRLEHWRRQCSLLKGRKRGPNKRTKAKNDDTTNS